MKVAVLIFSLLMIPEMGKASACPFQGFLEIEKAKPTQNNPATYVSDQTQWQTSLRIQFQKDTEKFFALYTTGKLTSSDLACIDSSDRLKDQIQTNFSSLFLRFSAERLTQSKSTRVQSYAQSILEHLDSGLVFPMKLDLHLASDYTTRPAGFDRSTRGVFFNLFQIHAQDYSIYLIHEFAHALDPRLGAAIDRFNDESLTSQIAEWVKQKRVYTSLSTEEKRQVDAYVLAGLDRGLFAEWRAWLTTSELYLELLKNNEQQPIAFLDLILGSNRNLNSYLIYYG